MGVLAFVFAAVLAPPPMLVAGALSLPFFYFTAQSRWKDCVIWIIATIPYQYYFNVGGLALTHTEMYLFLFLGAYLLSRVYAEKSWVLPSALLMPALYGLVQFLPIATGQPEPAKNGVRILAAVFFCPRLPGNASPSLNWSGSWASSPSMLWRPLYSF